MLSRKKGVTNKPSSCVAAIRDDGVVNNFDANDSLERHRAIGNELFAELLVKVEERGYAMSRQQRRWVAGPQLAAIIRDALLGVPGDKRLSVGILLVHSLFEGSQYPAVPIFWRLKSKHNLLGVEQAELGLSLEDLQLLLSFDPVPRRSDATGLDPHLRIEYLDFLLRRTAELAAAPNDRAMAVLDEIATRLNVWNPKLLTSAEQKRLLDLRRRAAELTGTPSPQLVEPPAVYPVDGFGAAVVELLGKPPWPVGVNALLRHLGTASTARPSARWESNCRGFLDGLEKPADLVRSLIELLVSAPPLRVERSWGPVDLVLLGGNGDLARGLVWCAGVVGGSWVPALLQAVAERMVRESRGWTLRPTSVRGEKVPCACVEALVRMGDPDAIAALAQLRQLVENKVVRTRIDQVLDRLASDRGLGIEELLERYAPSYGLDEAGRRSIEVGDHIARIELGGTSGATTRWIGPDGAESAAPPPETPEHAAATAKVNELARQIARAAVAERSRIEGTFVTQQNWAPERFWSTYVEHPLLGYLCRGLIWTATRADGTRLIGVPEGGPDRRIVGLDGSVTALGDDVAVRLWHPIEGDGREVQLARQLVSARNLSQPIRQVWRETFRPDEFELNTALYSNRYSGHILRFKQLFALSRRKGWSGGFLSGAWDGGQSGNPMRTFPAFGLRAVWTIVDRDPVPSGRIEVELCVSDRVQFEPAELPEMIKPPPVPIGEVPAIVFSETMRDIDFFVASSSIATDPNWIETVSGERRLAEYFDRIATEGLGTTVATRREALAELLGLGLLGSQHQLTERSLIVEGKLGRYVIDLATANVRLDPPGRWLSLRSPTSSITYPWDRASAVDDDEILWRILARASLLAADTEISDRRLLAQIRRG